MTKHLNLADNATTTAAEAMMIKLTIPDGVAMRLVVNGILMLVEEGNIRQQLDRPMRVSTSKGAYRNGQRPNT